MQVEQGTAYRSGTTRHSRTQRPPKGVDGHLAGVLLLPLLLVAGAHRDSCAGPVGSAPEGTTSRWIMQPNVQLRRTAPAAPISLERDGRRAASLSAPLDVPLGAVTLLTQGFEGAFPASPWSVAGDPTWDDTEYRHYTGSRSAYCVDGGASRVSPPGPYPNNCDSWMEAGPFDLSDATSAHLAFRAYVRTELTYDFFSYGASHDGATYVANTVSGDMGTSWLACPGGTLPELNLSGFLGDSSVWIAFVFSSDSSTTHEGAYVDDILLTKSIPAPPTLTWAGTPNHETDGVDPDHGQPNSTTFTFKVKYTDPSGSAPRRARCIISRKDCGDSSWRQARSLALVRESGDIATGAIYSGSTTLANLVYKHRFSFIDSTGADVAGDPANSRQGPMIEGRPWLCWTGGAGYAMDGVQPDSGPPGTRFKFAVKYADSAGDSPGTYKLLIRRGGTIVRRPSMSPAPAGDLRIGKVYRVSVTLTDPGPYEYRFYFVDVSGTAVGPPTNWTAGPTLTGTSSVAVTSLAALRTAAGAQVTFSLSGTANLTATVTNIAGRPIRTIVADRLSEAGLQTLLWDRRAGTGLPVPAGVYLIRVTARTADGGHSTALATVALR